MTSPRLATRPGTSPARRRHFSVMDKAGNMVAVTKTITCSSRPASWCQHWHHHGRRHGRLRPETRVGELDPARQADAVDMSPTLVLDPQGRPFMALARRRHAHHPDARPGHLERDRSRHADSGGHQRAAPLQGRTGNLSMRPLLDQRVQRPGQDRAYDYGGPRFRRSLRRRPRRALRPRGEVLHAERTAPTGRPRVSEDGGHPIQSSRRNTS